ncbi:cobyrinate a,c-diamide synthase [Aestuariibius sp. 2305UL40-4]|uniref:cobyrinate a,c-diamide synthase n=1 Tax=Aestuariibius violaceus TaxID=3234132 RepID=UPI00345E4D44
MPGLILAAPASGSGKTTVTLGLLRALSRQGIPVAAAKSGPDYIDPRFHEAACGRPCLNLDAWAMSEARIRSLATTESLLLIEGAMGLFDGAPPHGKGATADLARMLDLPVVLVIDAARMAQSIAPLVAGFAAHDPAVRIAGVILNRIGSDRHERILHTALTPLGIPVLGALPRDDALALPSRHLGLVQAGERADLESFLDDVADRISAAIDLDALRALAAPIEGASLFRSHLERNALKGRRIAIARDVAFAFTYQHQLALQRDAGVEHLFFSPLADDPVPEADEIVLPGGYPELHAARLAAASRFLDSLREAARTTDIYGECGGYMVLGESLTDADGMRHKMAGLLGLETSFATRKLHLGYRTLRARGGALKGFYKGHEFHYATTLRAEGAPLFEAWDAEGIELPPMGLTDGRVSGSFAHIIDTA